MVTSNHSARMLLCRFYCIKTVVVLCLVLLFATFSAQAQRLVAVNTFTTENGLPSNHIYDMAQDNQGFLWIATNNGVSRFDGKYFQNFSVKEGLPSNDAVQVVKDGNGTIWVNCYKEPLSYFDQVNNRFVLFNKNEQLSSIYKTFFVLGLTEKGDIFLRHTNYKASVMLRRLDSIGKSYIVSPLQRDLRISDLTYQFDCTARAGLLKALFYYKSHFVDSLQFNYPKEWFCLYLPDKFYFQSDFTIKQFHFTHISPLQYRFDSVVFRFPIARLLVLANQQTVVVTSPMIYLLNDKDLSVYDSIPNNSSANTVFIDKIGHLWVGTMDKGLIHYHQGGIRQVNVPPELINPNYLSIAISPQGQLFAGNMYGQLLDIHHAHFTSHLMSRFAKSSWLRKTIWVNNKVVTLSDYEYTVGLTKKRMFFNSEGSTYSLKSAIALHDSIVLIGFNAGLIWSNMETGSYKILNATKDRTLSLVKGAGDLVYYISRDGVYQYNCKSGHEVHVPLKEKMAGNKPVALAYATDSTLWVATTGGDVLVLKNDQQVAAIPNSAGLPQNIACMSAFGNKVWVGSKTGISVIEYAYKHQRLAYTVNNISKTDGLTCNVVNDFAFYNDTVFAATESGISAIPIGFSSFENSIAPQLTAVKVNQQTVANGDHFNLAADQNNITLSFAGVDLSGHFAVIQYRVDADTVWNDLAGNTLNVQLYSGSHTVQGRAKDVNNRVSNRTLQLHFIIGTPLYRQPWFIALACLLGPGLFFWYLYSRRKEMLRLQYERQMAADKADFDKRLAVEQSANRITADLHDDLGTNLSSINVYSNIASQLMDTDTNKAKDMLANVTQKTQQMLENLGEIIWSLKTGNDQFVNIESRIKNYISDALGATNMVYIIQIEPAINQLKEVRLRKNVILIVKEAVNNALKYSKATGISVKLSLQDNLITITIADNGTGFAEKAITTGNGLGNMRKRAEELGGTLSIASLHGTVVTAEIPVGVVG